VYNGVADDVSSKVTSSAQPLCDARLDKKRKSKRDASSAREKHARLCWDDNENQLLAVEIREIFLQGAEFRQIADHDVRVVRVIRGVVLVIGFRIVEGF
jgi:hypothetical protein